MKISRIRNLLVFQYATQQGVWYRIKCVHTVWLLVCWHNLWHAHAHALVHVWARMRVYVWAACTHVYSMGQGIDCLMSPGVGSIIHEVWSVVPNGQCHCHKLYVIIGSAEALPIVREVRSVRERVSEREREREIQRERGRRKWRHLSSAEISDEFCTFPCQKFAP